MITDVKTIIFQRDDLMQIFEDYPIELIKIEHFSNNLKVFEELQTNYLAMFIDVNGEVKFFKNRFGKLNTYEYDRLKIINKLNNF